MRALWGKGYEASTVEDLTAATGLAASSLYAAFGSKRGVLEAALARYDRDRDELLRPLEHGTEGLADLRCFLESVRRAVAGPDGRGCFMVNTATEVAPHDPGIARLANRYRERVRDAIAATLTRAAARGEIPGWDVLGRARVLQSGVYGALVAARAGDPAEARATLDALERTLVP